MRADGPGRFEVTPPGKAAWLFLLALGLGTPLALLGALAVAGARDVFDAWPAGLATALLAAALGLAARRRSVTIEHGRLVVRAAMYTLRVPLAEIDGAQARLLDLAERTEWKPRLKTNALAMPGFSAGYFRAGGKRRLFCLLTDRRRVLVLAQRDGPHLLLSLQRPQALIDALARSQPRDDPSHPARTPQRDPAPR
jgi:hypothetical protein